MRSDLAPAGEPPLHKGSHTFCLVIARSDFLLREESLTTFLAVLAGPFLAPPEIAAS
jgi:hypothetical protein